MDGISHIDQCEHNLNKETCAICGNSENLIKIDIEDFELPCIYKKCLTKDLEQLIDKAEYLHTAMNTAQGNSYSANEKLLNMIQKMKKEHSNDRT